MICYSTEGFLPLPVSTSPPALVGATGVSFRKRGCLMARQGLFWHQQNRGRHSGANNTNSNFQQVPQNLFIESKVSKVESENRGHCIVCRSKPNIAFSAAVKDMIPLVKHGPAFWHLSQCKVQVCITRISFPKAACQASCTDTTSVAKPLALARWNRKGLSLPCCEVRQMWANCATSVHCVFFDEQPPGWSLCVILRQERLQTSSSPQTFTTLSTSLVWLSGATFHHCFFAQLFAMRSTSTRTVFAILAVFYTSGETSTFSTSDRNVRWPNQSGEINLHQRMPRCARRKLKLTIQFFAFGWESFLNLCLCTVSPLLLALLVLFETAFWLAGRLPCGPWRFVPEASFLGAVSSLRGLSAEVWTTDKVGRRGENDGAAPEDVSSGCAYNDRWNTCQMNLLWRPRHKPDKSK